jgi:hypothetical protein
MTKLATCCSIFLLCSFTERFQGAAAFTFSQPGRTKTSFRDSGLNLSSPDTHSASGKVEGSTFPDDQASKWRSEAERIRLEAEKMEASLTLNKIDSIERKLRKKVWLEKHPAEQADLEKKLEALQRKLAGDDTVIMQPNKDLPLPVSVETASRVNGSEASKSSPSAVSTRELSEVSSAEKVKRGKGDPTLNPLSGFDEEDLELYLPAAEEIEARMTNATLNEKLETFQTAPELQEHFKKKIHTMLVQPMEDIQRLEEMKQKYLFSTSSVKKEQLKKEIDRLEKALEDDGPFSYSNSIYKGLPILTEEETVARFEAVGALPQVLQSLYKARTGIEADGDLRLAIQLDHYESQVQLLEQIRYVAPLDNECREETVMGLNSLPSSVRDHLAKGLGLNDGNNNDAIIRELTGVGDNPVMRKLKNDPSWQKVQEAIKAEETTPDLPEYDDIEFVDRSRYMDEFYPSIARLEGQHPSMKDVEQFLAEIVDKKAFMVNRKPERVVGGYYIRGEILDSEDYYGIQMVKRLQKKLDSSPLGQKLYFFFIPDPSPYTDEEIESGVGHEPIMVLTTKNPDVLYDYAKPTTKGAISALGICSILIFSLAICELQPSIQEHIESAQAAGETDISWLTDIAALIAVSSASIQIGHEAAHRLVAWKDKVRFIPESCPRSAMPLHCQSLMNPILKLVYSCLFTSLISDFLPRFPRSNWA